MLSPLIGAALGILYIPLALIVAVTAKRTLVGRYTSMRAPVWSGFYFRHWMVQRLVQLIPWGLLQGTVFQNAALRALGARIGARVHIHRGVNMLEGGWDLLEIGDDVMISQGATVGLVELDDSCLVVGPVRLEAGATLDIRSGVAADTVVGAGALLAPLSALPSGGRIPPAELWDGVPAQPAGAAPTAPTTEEVEWAPGWHGLATILGRFALNTFLGLPFLAFGIVLLVAYGVTGQAALTWLFSPRSEAWISAILIGLVMLQLPAYLLLQALVLRLTKSVPDGVHSRWSTTYLRIWLRSGLLQQAGNWLAGSLYWRWWLRLAGMRLGQNAEVSTIIDTLPENVTVDDESFFADGIYLAGPRLLRGTATTAHTSFGSNTFFGNHCVIPAGTHLPKDILLGVCTVADASRVRPGTSWFGHPPFELPRREVVELDRSLTHEPGLLRFTRRLLWETLRFALPAAPMAVFFGWLELVSAAATQMTGPMLFLVGLPAASLAAAATLAVGVVALKWLLLGRVRPGQHGLWSGWCCRWDFLYMAWDRLARAPVGQLGGTLLLGWYLRAMGMRIGRRVVLGGSFAQVVDPDMLRFEDGATVDAMFQAHSFEDRVLKIGHVHIRRQATARRASVLMYGADLGERCRVAPHSVVMKNEHLLPDRFYDGVPTQG